MGAILFSQIENEADQDSPTRSNETLTNHIPTSFPNNITNIEATFTNTGGELCTPLNSDVRITVPSGAIPAGVNQPVFFRVFSEETTLLRDIPKAPDETLISPVVECGPHDIYLLKSVEIIVPHCLCLSEAKKEWITVYRCGRLSAGVEGSDSICLFVCLFVLQLNLLFNLAHIYYFQSCSGGTISLHRSFTLSFARFLITLIISCSTIEITCRGIYRPKDSY